MLWLARLAIGSEVGRLVSVVIFAVALSMAALAAGYVKGRNDRAALDRSAALQAQVEQLQEDIKARDRLAAFNRTLTEQRLEEKAEDDERIATLEQDIASGKRPACRLTPADVERLRAIGEDRPNSATGGPRRAAPASRHP